METWQSDFITNNLTTLIERTNCDGALIASLIERRVLSQPDQAELNTHANKYDKCLSLYHIIQSRCDGFNGMIAALKTTGQNGALTILEQGLIQKQIEESRQKFLDPPAVPTSKWEQYILDHKVIFLRNNTSKAAIADLTHEFYTEEMTCLLKDHKYNSPNVICELHRQISNDMIEIYANQAEMHKIEHSPIQQILAQSFKLFQSNYHLFLNGNLNFEEAPAIGIDLGTCNLCVAVCVQGKIKIFMNKEGEKTTPSYLSFLEDGDINIGKIARKNAHENPQYTIYDSKRMIGRTFEDKTLKQDRDHWPFNVISDGNVPRIVTREKAYLAEEISAKLLQECKLQAERDLNQIVKKAVITVPAYFNNSQREATKRAGQMAGLEVLQILNEPTAAAITYRQERYYDTAKSVLIFDMGGGTFDVAVANINGEKIDIIGIDGDAHLGGEDFDRIIMDYCISEFEKTTRKNVKRNKTEETEESLARLLFECEEAKKDLSSTNKVKLSVKYFMEGKHLNVYLDRRTFEELCHPKFQQMIDIVDRVLRDGNIKKEAIEDIILVGGSTRIPKLQEMIQDYFGGKKLNNSIYQDVAVAYGAAVQAAILNGEEVKKLLNIEQIVDAIPMSIGIQCIKNGVSGQFSRIILKNSKYPAKYTQRYVTHKENQETAWIRVFQGEQESVADNFFVGMFRFEGIPKAPKGKESFDVCMEIDDMGILKVTASCKGIAGTKDLTVTLLDSSGLQYHLEKRGSSFDLEKPQD